MTQFPDFSLTLLCFKDKLNEHICHQVVHSNCSHQSFCLAADTGRLSSSPAWWLTLQCRPWLLSPSEWFSRPGAMKVD